MNVPEGEAVACVFVVESYRCFGDVVGEVAVERGWASGVDNERVYWRRNRAYLLRIYALHGSCVWNKICNHRR